MLVINCLVEKGGTAKTTTAREIAAGLALTGYRVLACDLDPQSNLTKCLLGLVDRLDFAQTVKVIEEYKNSDKRLLTSLNLLERYVKESVFTKDMADVLLNPSCVSETIVETKIHNLSLIPASHRLSDCDIALKSNLRDDPTGKLKKALDIVRDHFDVVVIDNPPFSNALTFNSISACSNDGDLIIVPIKVDNGGLEGMITTIKDAIEWLDKKPLQYDFKILPVMKQKTKIDTGIIDMLYQLFPDRVFNTSIQYQTKPVTEASLKKEILINSSKTKVAEQYRALISELDQYIKTSIEGGSRNGTDRNAD